MKLIDRAWQVLDDLLDGNQRFREGHMHSHSYTPEALLYISRNQAPKAAIIACADSRVSPDLIFDQPLGSIFASRVPGNVASDSAKWMLDIAIQEFKVPLVMVMGHTGCLAVGQLLDGDKGGAGGLHRYSVLTAVYRAKEKNPADLYLEAVEQNVRQTVEHLARESHTVRNAIEQGITSIVGAVYEMETGTVYLLETDTDTE